MRLVDIDSLKGCAIIRPTSSEEIAHIQACKGLIAHKDIPTAYDVEAKVAKLEKKSKEYTKKAEEHEVYEDYCTRYYSIANGIDTAISIVRGKE